MSVTDWAVGVIEAMGGPGVALVLALTSGFPPIPGELLLPFVGVTAAVRGPGWWWGVAWTTAGSPAGALGLYGAGRPVGERRVRALIARVPQLGGRRRRRGHGVVRAPRGTFVATVVGSGGWNAVFVLTGYWFGRRGGAALQGFVAVCSAVLGVLGAVVVAGFAPRAGPGRVRPSGSGRPSSSTRRTAACPRR